MSRGITNNPVGRSLTDDEASEAVDGMLDVIMSLGIWEMIEADTYSDRVVVTDIADRHIVTIGIPTLSVLACDNPDVLRAIQPFVG